MATMSRDTREALAISAASRAAARTATETENFATVARRMAAAFQIPEEMLGFRAADTHTSEGGAELSSSPTSTPNSTANPFFDMGRLRDSFGTEAAVREGRGVEVGVPTLVPNGMMGISSPTVRRVAPNMISTGAIEAAPLRATGYFRTGGSPLGQDVQPGAIVGLDRDTGAIGAVSGDFLGDIVGDFRVGVRGVTLNPWSNTTIAQKPTMTMDEAISTLLQKISDALPQKASSEYNDAVSDVLEVVEAFRVTQIEPPKVENSNYQDMLRQLGSRVITDIVKEVILAYRYTKLEDNDLLANLKTALNNALRGRVSENTIVTSVRTHVDHTRHQRVVQVRFKIHKDDDLIHTQEISMNVNS